MPMMMIGPWQMVIIVLIVLLLFGGRRLATAGKGLGEAIGNFKRALKSGDDSGPRNGSS